MELSEEELLLVNVALAHEIKAEHAKVDEGSKIGIRLRNLQRLKAKVEICLNEMERNRE